MGLDHRASSGSCRVPTCTRALDRAVLAELFGTAAGAGRCRALLAEISALGTPGSGECIRGLSYNSIRGLSYNSIRGLSYNSMVMFVILQEHHIA